jgi:hypothetical protein
LFWRDKQDDREGKPLAGKTIAPSMLVNLPQLVTAYCSGKPDFSESPS